ncbi:MAG: nuclear transport factor 2 family protein [Gammaproteobacteria bacterium]
MVTRSREKAARGRFFARLGCAMLSASLAGCGGTSALNGTGTPKIAALQEPLMLLERDAARLEGAKSIRRLQRAYGYYLDQALWDPMADLFAPEATLEIGLDGVYVGQKRIRSYFYHLGGGHQGLTAGQLNDHLILQPVVDVSPDGTTAKGRWRALIMGTAPGVGAAWGEGTYENEYVKQNGVWKISKVHWYQTFVVPYAGGWTKNADLTGGIYVSKQLPPDRPPSEHYEVWPGVYTPPFHYKNPVAEPASGLPSDAASDATPAAVALRSAITLLHGRIERLRDRDEIENLVSMYGYYLDKQQWDLLTDLFAEDSTMEIAQRGVYVGKKGARRALELFGPQNIEKDHVHTHMQVQPVIHVSQDGQRAWVRSRAVSQLGTFGQVGVWGDGVYENEFVKENGVWKIRHDHVYTTFFTPYDPGWSFGARPAPKVSAKIPPDGPPSELYESLPEIYVPPFHYRNPVTGEGGTAPLPGGVRSMYVETPAAVSASAAAMTAGLPAASRKAVERIERNVTEIEDENAIENLQRTYGFYADKAMWKEAADLFAADGTLEIGGRGVFAGKARVLQYLTRLAPEGLTHGRLINHLQLQPIVHVAPDGASARGRWRFLAETGEWQKSQAWGSGVYENEYVKEGGVWKIKSLHAYFRLYTPYTDGWAKTSLPLAGVEKDFPPDRAPTVAYEVFPATFVAPFHYKNPVTGK